MTDLSRIPYMRWAKSQAAVGEYALTSSAVPPLDWHSLGMDPQQLELCRYNAYGDESLLAELRAEGTAESDVLLASSTTHAHFCLAASILSPGDRVLYESPGYLPLVDSLSMLGVEAVRFVRRFEDGFSLPREHIERVVEQACPRLLLVTDLHNPSGVTLDEDERRFLADLCERTGLEIICDEVYRPFLDPDPGPLHRWHPAISSVNGLNKSYGLPLIRVGWALASRARTERARRVLDATTVHNSCLSDQVAGFAWQARTRLLDRARAIAAEGWAICGPWLEGSPLACVPPAGGLICFPRVPDAFEDGDALRAHLLEHGVGVTPGSYFEAPRHVRIGFGLAPQRLREALLAIDHALAGRP